jgi:hypothetical protein
MATTLGLAWLTCKCLSLNQTGFSMGSMGAPNPTPPSWDMRTRMTPGNRYWVDLPDGRRIVVNYRGSVDSYWTLPCQPAGGANNAMYTDLDSGLSWIWTVPAGASNVPQWIDP